MTRVNARNLYVALLASVAVAANATRSAADEDLESSSRWWPVQRVAAAVVELDQGSFPAPSTSYQMMAQSIAGLAAKAVNDGRGDELVWIGDGNAKGDEWFKRLLLRHPRLEVKHASGIWPLIDAYAKKGIIKGYILYRRDSSKGELNEHRPGMDCSVNIATSLAGIVDGIIVDEQLEQVAKEHGLTKLVDVRDKTQSWCFENYRDQFNRHIVCTQDPRKPHVRDLAIAQQTFTIYGYDEPLEAVMKWLEPLSPILGWNGGDEFKTTELSSRWGHIQTATDWCTNLPVLMAGTERETTTKVPTFDPTTIDWKDQRSAVTFVCTDGDNVQWYLGNFFRGGEGTSYWANPNRGTIPFGWSCCFAHLAQLCPEAIDYASVTRKPNDSFIEWGGGYYYPDLFATNRENRYQLLAIQARRTWALMKASNTRLIGLNVADYSSADARKAYQIIANETEGLLGILIFQYSPYEAGAGETFWVKDGKGVELPVITARYSIWEHSNSRERAGTPAKIAREIGQTISQTPPESLPRYDCVMCHVWSYFKKCSGDDENAEDMSQQSAVAHGGIRGYSPAVWSAQRLSGNVRVVSPDEMFWRVRMKHNPSETTEFMNRFK